MGMNFWRFAVVLVIFVMTSSSGFAADVMELKSVYRHERVLVASDNAQVQHYLAFPAVLDLGGEILVSFKRGKSHADDAGAVLDLVRLGKFDRSVSQPQILATLDDKIMQMGEWVRFSNGDVANYIDVQQVAGSARVGLHRVCSSDGGRTFGPIERVGVVDGVEYGYAFESVTQGTTTWMLVMTFSNLPGGKSVYPPRPQAGSVDMIRTDDNGQTWRFVRNLSHEFGDIPINESTFLSHGDGFLVSTRGYDNRERLHLTDSTFKVQKQVDLTAMYPFISKFVGRPRLFARDGHAYLLGRNYTDSSGPMKLCLFRLARQTLEVAAYAVLDNAQADNVTDGYYAGPYFREKDGKSLLNVVTYKGLNRRLPQIIELEFLWDQVR